MAHLWLRAEERGDERRVPLLPEGAGALAAAGHRVTVEDSAARIVPVEGYRAAGAEIAAAGSWRSAPSEALVLGLKELQDDALPLRHRHIFFGHAYKGQPGARALMDRFRAGGGALYDLESLVDAEGRRVAAFGHWAGFAGAAVALQAWIAQAGGGLAGPVGASEGSEALVAELARRLEAARPQILVIGAEGRVGRGAAALCGALGLSPTLWDKAETAAGGPFLEVLDHDIFLNCILALPGTPVFVTDGAATTPRRLGVIGDIACDPASAFTPIRVNDRTTTWEAPARRVHAAPPLDVVAIDNLPSLLPREASEDFAAQLLPHLMALDDLEAGVWARARAVFDRHVAQP